MTPEDAEAIQALINQTTDFTIVCRDWPHWQTGPTRIPYWVVAINFFDQGTGCGRTIAEAVQRALKALDREKAKSPRVEWDDIRQILGVDTTQEEHS